MWLWRFLRRVVRALLPPAAFVAVAVYFAWSATQGDRGLDAYRQRQQLAVQAQAELARARDEQTRWEKRVDGLMPAHVDKDALDERARALLNRSDPTDIIVPWTAKERLF